MGEGTWPGTALVPTTTTTTTTGGLASFQQRPECYRTRHVKKDSGVPPPLAGFAVLQPGRWAGRRSKQVYIKESRTAAFTPRVCSLIVMLASSISRALLPFHSPFPHGSPPMPLAIVTPSSTGVRALPPALPGYRGSALFSFCQSPVGIWHVVGFPPFLDLLAVYRDHWDMALAGASLWRDPWS